MSHEQERNALLASKGQWRGKERRPRRGNLNFLLDCVAYPPPANNPSPMAGPCLIWRFGLRGGYGALQGKGAHVVAFQQSRRRAVQEGMKVLHLCGRRFCVQPAHLYEGTTKDNAEDRVADRSQMNTYKTWQQIGKRFQVAFDVSEYARSCVSFGWEAPPMDDSLLPECPHKFIRFAGSARMCRACSELDQSGSRPPIDVLLPMPAWAAK